MQVRPHKEFIAGVTLGMFCMWLVMRCTTDKTSPPASRRMTTHDGLPYTPAAVRSTQRQAPNKKELDTERSTPTLASPVFYEVDNRIAKELSREVRVLCWVSTYEEVHHVRAVVVKETWGSRCSKLIFISDASDPKLPAFNLSGVPPGYEHLTAKTMHAFDHVYKYYLDDYDWFMKADDDTYVIMENLRFLLHRYDPVEALWFGARMTKPAPSGYMSGGAGYVLSKAALRQFGERSDGACQEDGESEDVAFGQCMSTVGVRAADAHDLMGRTLFHVYDPLRHVATKDYLRWFVDSDVDGGRGNVSDFPVSFHYMAPVDMYMLEYYVYRLRPFGIIPQMHR